MKPTAYLVQAATVGLWWVCLALNETFFSAFQFEGVSPTAFWSFLAPDVVLIAGLSVVRAYRASRTVELVILGAFGYATLYCCNATVLTGSGFLATGLMTLGLAYNCLLCFDSLLFRASTSGPSANAAKTLAQILCIWLVSLVVAPYLILDAFGQPMSPDFGFGALCCVVVFAGFSCLGLTSAYFMVRDGNGTPLQLDQANDLVITGPYRYVRNPMAIAGIGQGLAIAGAYQSAPLLVYALFGALVWQVVVRPIEERDLAERFGERYESYREQVVCWTPTFLRVGRKTPR